MFENKQLRGEDGQAKVNLIFSLRKKWKTMREISIAVWITERSVQARLKQNNVSVYREKKNSTKGLPPVTQDLIYSLKNEGKSWRYIAEALQIDQNTVYKYIRKFWLD